MSVEAYSTQASDEIRHFSGHSCMEGQGAWLAANGMLRHDAAEFTITTEQPWVMPGSESYIMQFAVSDAHNDLQRFVAKACVKLPVIPSLNDWLSRRMLLREYGIAVPRLHAVNRGVLIEEHVAYNFKDAYEVADPDVQAALCRQFLQTYNQVWELGFRPISLHDVRSHGTDVVLIDFGSDLGAPQLHRGGLNEHEVAVRALNEMHRALGRLDVTGCP